MKTINEQRLSELTAGSKVCAFCAGAGFAALLTGNALLGGAATLCGIGCAFSWW